MPAPTRPDPRSLDPRMTAARGWRAAMTVAAAAAQGAARRLPTGLRRHVLGDIAGIAGIVDRLTDGTIARGGRSAGAAADMLRELIAELARIAVDDRPILTAVVPVPDPPRP